MDNTLSQQGRARVSLLPSASLTKIKQPYGLIVGVVKEAETGFDGSFTLINIETGESENFYLMLKNKAGFLTGRLVIYNLLGNVVIWLEDNSYSFAVIAPVRIPKAYVKYQEGAIICPECEVLVKIVNIGRHLRKIHNYQTV